MSADLRTFNAAMWAARVFRGKALEHPRQRVFWLLSALDEFKRARVARARMRGAQ